MRSSRSAAEAAGSRLLGQDRLRELLYWDKALGWRGGKPLCHDWALKGSGAGLETGSVESLWSQTSQPSISIRHHLLLRRQWVSMPFSLVSLLCPYTPTLRLSGSRLQDIQAETRSPRSQTITNWQKYYRFLLIISFRIGNCEIMTLPFWLSDRNDEKQKLQIVFKMAFIWSQYFTISFSHNVLEWFISISINLSMVFWINQ